MLSSNEIKQIQSLKQIKFRRIHNQFVVEGHKSVSELPYSHFQIEKVYAKEEWITANQHLLTKFNMEVIKVSPKEMGRISNFVTPQDVLAVVNIPEITETDYSSLNGIILYLDKIQDPGNFGTILRTADWFGIKHVFCSTDCVELYNPKVVQASMGSICRINVKYTGIDVFENLPDSFKVYGSFLEGTSLYATTFPQDVCMVVGNESKGISEEVVQHTTEKIHIPSYADGNAKAESLNASIATSVIIAEIRRQIGNNN